MPASSLDNLELLPLPAGEPAVLSAYEMQYFGVLHAYSNTLSASVLAARANAHRDHLLTIYPALAKLRIVDITDSEFETSLRRVIGAPQAHSSFDTWFFRTFPGAALPGNRPPRTLTIPEIVELTNTSYHHLAVHLAEYYGWQYIDLPTVTLDPRHTALFQDGRLVRRYQALPLRLDKDNTYTIVFSDPRDQEAQSTFAEILNQHEYALHPTIAPYDAIQHAIEEYYIKPQSISRLIQESDIDPLPSVTADDLDENSNAIVNFVTAMIDSAIAHNASDIHIEPETDTMQIRQRIDGQLRPYAGNLQRVLIRPIIARIKILAGMNVSEHRLSQDGSIHYRNSERQISIRVSIQPTTNGEAVVLRILPTVEHLPALGQLGFLPDTLDLFSRLIQTPGGIFLVTGPTGSGKSTTLASILRSVVRPDLNALTVEDPVEYDLPGIRQTQVQPKIGLTFPEVLRSFLRQDPDIIMIGEIRDQETAQTAVAAALTGHQVFATLHTKTASGAITRLLNDFKVLPDTLSEALTGVLNQRLLLSLCPDCSVRTAPTAFLAKALNIPVEYLEHNRFKEARGCVSCKHRGYQGRQAIHELLANQSGDMHMAIRNREPSTALEDIAREESGFRTLRQDALEKATNGLLDLKTILRSTSL